MIIVILVLLLLILLNALYVAAEFATVSVRQPRILALADEGHRQAKIFAKILQDPKQFDQYIAACQVGITLSSLLLGAYGQQALAPWLEPFLPGHMADYGAATIILLILTVLQMILGEILPKSLALRYPTPLALYTIWPMKLSLWLMALPLFILNGSGHFFLKKIGLPQEGHHHVHSPTEIDYLLRESQDQGLLEQGISQRLRKALHLGERSVRELMVPRQEMSMLSLKMSSQEIIQHLQQVPFSRLPVWNESPDRVIGSVSVKHCLQMLAKHGNLDDFASLVEPLLALPKDLSVERGLHKLRERQVSMALLVDEYGGIAGLLTLQDILSELTGHLNDEFKSERNWVQTLADGRLRIAGRMRLNDLKEQFGVDWTTTAHTTVNGFLLAQWPHLPEVGEHWHDHQAELVIEEIKGHMIVSVLLNRRNVEAADV